VLKLLSDYPLVTLHFIRTTENLADYLTRQGLPKGDLTKVGLKNMKIPEIHEKLPKHTFTLTEWNKFCQENPQYLTITEPEIKTVTLALTQGISNVTDFTKPLNILQERLNRAEVVKAQKEEFRNLFEKCGKNKTFTTINKAKNEKVTYKTVMELLLRKQGKGSYKINWPEKLTGILLSYLHLIGHMGTGKMMENLKSYYIKNKYKKVKTFTNRCYPCFLMHRSSRKNVLGNYPIPSYPFEEVSMDLAENLNKIKGYENLLIVQDVLSDFILIFPLKTKTSNEVTNIFMNSILQIFNIKRIHSDNGSCFRNKAWLQILAAMGIKMIDSSSNNPSSRGKAERAVQQVKTILRKMLVNASSKTLNWEYLTLLISKVMNQSITPRTGFTPIEMIVGKGGLSKSFLDLPALMPPHHLVKDKQEEIKIKTEEI
jgi:hypothetical protein